MITYRWKISVHEGLVVHYRFKSLREAWQSPRKHERLTQPFSLVLCRYKLVLPHSTREYCFGNAPIQELYGSKDTDYLLKNN